MDKFKDRKQQIQILALMLCSLILAIISAYIIKEKENIFLGFYHILTSPAILITDFILVGGIGASFLNAFCILGFNFYLYRLFKVKINGTAIAALCTIFGFSFFGKNILNILPFYLGGILYSVYSHTDFKDNLINISFASALAPFVSAIAFNDIDFYYESSYINAIFLGVIIGFIIVPLSQKMYHFHQGYDLYNLGFTGGILGAVIVAILRIYNFQFLQQNLISTDYNIPLKVMCTASFAAIFAAGFYINDKSFSGFYTLLKDSGYKVDFTRKYGYGLSLMNMGINGFLGIIYIILTGQDFNGPLLAALFTLVGFSAHGKTAFNVLPILAGVYLAHFGTSTDSFTLAISGLFGTALAPIAGVYGFLPGMVAGWLHLAVVQNIGSVHGGMNLYNNGFSAGVVAAFLKPLLDMILHKKRTSKLIIQKKHKGYLKYVEKKIEEEKNKGL